MTIRTRSELMEIHAIVSTALLMQNRLRSFKSRADKFPASLAELLPALDRLCAVVSEIERIIEHYAELLHEESWGGWTKSRFTAEESLALQELSRSMNEISRFMHETGDAIEPVMKAKVDDTADPMVDYEIDAKIDYVLRESDPEFDDDHDNILSSRVDHLFGKSGLSRTEDDWRSTVTPVPFRKEPLSWLLHDLIEHDYGLDSPRLSARDCLRIGSIFLDIQVWWQFHYDVDSGKWVKTWRTAPGPGEQEAPVD